jgi:hypothetical protein
MIARTGEAEHDAEQAYICALVDAEFLFGPEVNRYLNQIWQDICRLRMYRRIPESAPDFMVQQEKKQHAFEQVTRFYEKSPKLFGPYINLTHKNTPFWRPWS